MPDGRVLSYGTKPDGTQTGFFRYDIWDPQLGVDAGHSLLPNVTSVDLFCSAQLVLPQSGDVLMLGGDNWTGSSTTNTGNSSSVIFTKVSGDHLLLGANMKRKRWYATATTLPNGAIYIQGGQGGSDRPEVRNPTGSFKLLSNVNTSALRWWYPRNFVAPDGRIFGIADRTMYYINWGGSGSYTGAGTMPANGPSGVTSSEVMYAPGKILRVGGGAPGSSGGGNGKGAASIIDINGDAPTVKPIDPLPGGVGFHWLTATVVADGRVVVTGGSPLNNLTSAGWNKRAYIWNPLGPPQDPGRGAWTEGAIHDQAPARLYHSIALLLPDATLLVGGGGAPGPQTNLNAEIYYPPYLFDASGQFASRPKINKAPASAVIGQPFSLTMSNSSLVKRVTLIKTGSVTHSFNMDQRFQVLNFDQSGQILTVKGSMNANVAPPGMYLVFAINAEGVPSIARIVKFRRS